MSPQIKQDVWTLVVPILLTINGFFIKRLVDKQDSTEIQVYALREDVRELKTIMHGVLPGAVVDSMMKWRKKKL